MHEKRPIRLARATRVLATAAVLACLVVRPARPGMPATAETVAAADITAISAEGVVVEGHPAEEFSGLLVADAKSGTIYLYQSGDREFGTVTPAELATYLDLGSPRAIAHSSWGGCVWDAAKSALICFNVFTGKYWVEYQGPPFVSPTRIAVSPEGLIAILDREAGGLFFLIPGVNRRGLPSSRPMASPKPFQVPELADLRPAGLAFLSFDSLAVLDENLNSIVTISFALDKEKLYVGNRSVLPVGERGKLSDLRALAAQDGVLYVAAGDRVYLYIESEGRIVPALPQHEGHSDIRQIAASRRNLYILDGVHIDRYPRTVPVDLRLEGDPVVSQTALLEVYSYLGSRTLLEFRTARTNRSYATLEEFLLEQKVLLVPSRLLKGWRPERADRAAQKGPAATVDPERELASFVGWFCKINVGFCDVPRGSVLTKPVAAGTELSIPQLEVRSRMRRRDVQLDGHSPEWHLDRLVIDADERKRADRDLLAKLNKDLDSAMRSGTVVLPVETWHATVVVPVYDYSAQESEIWRLADRYDGAALYTHEVYTHQMKYSMQPPDDVGAPTRCSSLRDLNRAWMAELRYPYCRGDGRKDKLLFPAIAEAAVSVGVFEKDEAVQQEHQIFLLDNEHRCWHAPVSFDLEPISVPSSARASGPQVVSSADTFISSAHHGTHVAALIGGRKGDCWSGLLPRARLVLVDVTSPATVFANVIAALDAGTRVFNVSQELGRSEATATAANQRPFINQLKRLFTEDADHALFVVAAGNDGLDLNTEASLPVPAAWGDAANIVTVTAFGARQAIIGQISGPNNENSPGVNKGMKYVDLAAPGLQVVSATGPDSYGPATGTSQAAPVVAAAAAYLVDENAGAKQSPGDSKARLIATADWKADLQGVVLGGLFNFEDAVRYPTRSVLHLNDDGENVLYSIVAPDRAKIRFVNRPHYYERGEANDDLYERQDIQLKSILSLKHLNDGVYRVVFRDPRTNRLRILLDAQIAGTVQCNTLERLNEETLSFVRSTADDATCDQGIEVNGIIEYVAAMPYHVDWR